MSETSMIKEKGTTKAPLNKGKTSGENDNIIRVKETGIANAKDEPKALTSLNEVRAYGEKENEILWENLDDKVPRDLPIKADDLRQTDLLVGNPVTNSVPPDKKKRRKFSYVIFVIIGVILGLFLLDMRAGFIDFRIDSYRYSDQAVERLERGIPTSEFITKTFPCDQECANQRYTNCMQGVDGLSQEWDDYWRNSCEENLSEVLKTGQYTYSEQVWRPCDEECQVSARRTIEYYKADNLLKNYISQSTDLIVVAVSISLFLFIIGIILFLKNGKVKTRKSYVIPFDSGSSKPIIDSVLQYGVKCKATIVDVRYVPSDPRNVELYFIKNNSEETSGWFAHDLPVFVIRYKFVLPGSPDGREITHAIVVHDDPAKHFQPGMELNILAMKDPDDQFNIISMPYPFPLNKIVQLNEIYCVSKG